MTKGLLAPHKSYPPENSVGIVAMLNGDLGAFKLGFHSVLQFTDHPYMLTVVENMQPLTVRNYLKAVQKNHNVNVLSYQNNHNYFAELALGVRYMFAYKTVKFGCVLRPRIVVELDWLGDLVSKMIGDENIGLIKAKACCLDDSTLDDLILFRRDAFERLDGFKENYQKLISEAGWRIETADALTIHRINQRRPKK